MVPARSHRVSRVPWYSGSCCGRLRLWVRGSHPLRLVFPVPFPCRLRPRAQSEPRHARMAVWALPVPLAATPGIDFSSFSSGYLDVSVRRVPLHTLCVGVWIHGVPPCGFPHSDTRGSQGICPSPRLFAACHVFHRLPVPRHPPCALISLTCPQAPLGAAARPRIALRRQALYLPLFFCCFFVRGPCPPCRSALSGMFMLYGYCRACRRHLKIWLPRRHPLPDNINLGCLTLFLDFQYSVFKVQYLKKDFLTVLSVIKD